MKIILQLLGLALFIVGVIVWNGDASVIGELAEQSTKTQVIAVLSHF